MGAGPQPPQLPQSQGAGAPQQHGVPSQQQALLEPLRSRDIKEGRSHVLAQPADITRQKARAIESVRGRAMDGSSLWNEPDEGVSRSE